MYVCVRNSIPEIGNESKYTHTSVHCSVKCKLFMIGLWILKYAISILITSLTIKGMYIHSAQMCYIITSSNFVQYCSVIF